jgi:hypothetical protein
MGLLSEMNQKKPMDGLPIHMSRAMTGQYTAVEFGLGDLDFIYQFKIFESPFYGFGFLVKEGAVIIKHLHVGDIVTMRYYPEARDAEIEPLKTKIQHITKDKNGRFRGHYLVGLSIVGD